MESRNDISRITGLAKITHYEVTFEHITYTIAVKECQLETSDSVEDWPDYEIRITIAFNEDQKVLHWFKNPVFTSMQESWQSGENDCYFEHCLEDVAALMSLNGVAVLVTVRNH